MPNYFTTAVPRSYFSIRLSLNLSMTSAYQLAKKKNQHNKTHKQPTHNTPLVFFPPPMFSSYPKSFFAANEPTALYFPRRRQLVAEQRKDGAGAGREAVSLKDFCPSPRLVCIPPKEAVCCLCSRRVRQPRRPAQASVPAPQHTGCSQANQPGGAAPCPSPGHHPSVCPHTCTGTCPPASCGNCSAIREPQHRSRTALCRPGQTRFMRTASLKPR